MRAFEAARVGTRAGNEPGLLQFVGMQGPVMFEGLKRLFSAKPEPRAEISPAVAAAALMVEAARADQHYREAERAVIDRALADDFGVAPEDCAAVRAEAESRQTAAVGLHRFTSALRPLSPDAKVRLVEQLWRVILTDAKRDSFEDAVVRQVCGLLYVGDVDSGAARRRVQAERTT